MSCFIIGQVAMILLASSQAMQYVNVQESYYFHYNSATTRFLEQTFC